MKIDEVSGVELPEDETVHTAIAYGYKSAVEDILGFIDRINEPVNAPYQLAPCNEIWHTALREVRNAVAQEFKETPMRDPCTGCGTQDEKDFDETSAVMCVACEEAAEEVRREEDER